MRWKANVEADCKAQTESYIYVATERLTPLGWLVRRKALSVEATIWGLYTIAVSRRHGCSMLRGQNTLKFLNEEAASIHANVRVSSIFVSESGEWRLGGLDILSSMKEDDAVLYVSAPEPSNDSYRPDVSRACSQPRASSSAGNRQCRVERRSEESHLGSGFLPVWNAHVRGIQ